MKIVRLTDSAEGQTLAEGNAPKPQPGPHELLIQVYAAGVTAAELLWYPTLHRKTGEKRVDASPGHEFSGIIAAAGPEVGNFEIGQEVFGMNDWFADGAMAEYCLAPASSIARKPARLSHVEAASVPISALTAWQGLFERARLQNGEQVLVHGGAGAVGIFVVQLAKLHGAHVIATASEHNLDFVASLGADEVIDYEKLAFEKVVQDVDVVFDTVGGDVLKRSWSVLKTGGRVVTIATGGEAAADGPVKEAFFIVEPNQSQLTEIGELLQTGRLRPAVGAVVPLSQAQDAYLGRVKRSCGKIVVTVAA